MKDRKPTFGKFAEDYAMHRAGFPDSFFDRMQRRNLTCPGVKVLDLGTGTGTLARYFARQGLQVVGLEVDAQMIASSKGVDANERVHIEYVESSANSIPIEDKAFDLVTAGQCFHWFDKESVSHEVDRLLRPGGHLLIAYFDWVQQKGNPVDLMYQLKEKYIPKAEAQTKWPLGFYPKSAVELEFQNMNLEFTEDWFEQIPYTHEAWLGRLRAYNGLNRHLDSKVMDRFIQEYSESLSKEGFFKNLMIPHRLWFGIWLKK